jgi:hypothetical protein
VTLSAPSDITRVACPPGRLMSTANGSTDPVAAFTQQIEEACSHHDALISASVADFGSFMAALNGPHPQTPSFDNKDDDDDAADIAFVPPPHQPITYVEAIMCISRGECHPVNAQENKGFLDIIIVQPPSQPTPCAEAVMSLLGGDHQPLTTTILADIGLDHIRLMTHHTTVHRRNQPRRHPGCRHRPRAPNPLYDEAFPYLPQPTRGGISTSCAVMQHPMVRRHQQPHCRPGCHHQPCAPNPSCNEDLSSHPQQTMGGTSPPTPRTPTLLAQAINLPRSETASASPPLMPLSSPSLLPFKIVRLASMN